MKTKTYTTAFSFRRALEDRLNEKARTTEVQSQKLRRQLAFDRLLARLFHGQKDATPWALKGGYAMELRPLAPQITHRHSP